MSHVIYESNHNSQCLMWSMKVTTTHNVSCDLWKYIHNSQCLMWSMKVHPQLTMSHVIYESTSTTHNVSCDLWKNPQLTMPPRRKKLYSSMLSLLEASSILAHMWKEKRSLCLSNSPLHVYLLNEGIIQYHNFRRGSFTSYLGFGCIIPRPSLVGGVALFDLLMMKGILYFDLLIMKDRSFRVIFILTYL